MIDLRLVPATLPFIELSARIATAELNVSIDCPLARLSPLVVVVSRLLGSRATISLVVLLSALAQKPNPQVAWAVENPICISL
jgi:hypothetical protein